MKRNLLETVLGGVVLLVAALFFIFGYQTGDLAATDGYTLTANFSEIGGLKAGSDIRISGVKVGTISDISLDENYFAQLTLTLNNKVQLPTDTSARVSSESLLGGAYLALDPGAEEDFIEHNGKIRITQSAQDLSRLLGQFIFASQGEDAPE